MKIDTKLLEKVFLIFLAILFIYYLFLASKTNFLGEDESFYYYEGQLFSQSQYPAFLRLGTINVFAVFIPLFYASLFSLFGSSLVLAKMISTLFGFLTIIVVYLIGKKINFYVGFFASGILLSMVLFTNFMLIAYVDVPTAFFSILIFYAALKMDSVKKAIFTGAILALSFYTKDSEFFLAVVLILYSILIYIKDKNVKYLKLSLIAVLISIILFSPYVIKNIYYYNYPNFLAFNIIFNIFFHAPGPTSVTQSFVQQIASLSDFSGTDRKSVV
jgi:4-amino-4-deoxy-L-arabinose transferase-like glycosyltransferase